LRRLLPSLILIAACASTPTQEVPVLPEWDAIPAGITAALCHRLQMDGIGTIGADVALVKITQPIVSPQALATLGKQRRKVTIIHRALPVAAPPPGTSQCAWKPIDALDPARQFDAMVVELSAPVPNPSTTRTAGIIARASLGGAHPTWYWIEIVPHGQGWTVAGVQLLSV
jgi:hypothetical protein